MTSFAILRMGKSFKGLFYIFNPLQPILVGLTGTELAPTDHIFPDWKSGYHTDTFCYLLRLIISTSQPPAYGNGHRNNEVDVIKESMTAELTGHHHTEGDSDVCITIIF